jgi:uncharacterized membrane protein
MSWHAYGTCLTIAYIYLLIAVLLGWVLFNISGPGGIEIFRDIDSGFN